MTATLDECDGRREIEEIENECYGEVGEESATDGERSVEKTSHGTLPWIGALPNPLVGPMLVINGSGYLVPLCTAGDLLRGCKKFWRAAWNLA